MSSFQSTLGDSKITMIIQQIPLYTHCLIVLLICITIHHCLSSDDRGRHRKFKKLQVGSSLPHNTPKYLPTLNGKMVSLWEEDDKDEKGIIRPTILCFLRHLSWLPWQDHVSRLLSHTVGGAQPGENEDDTLSVTDVSGSISSSNSSITSITDCRIVFITFCNPSKPLHRLWITEWCKKQELNVDGNDEFDDSNDDADDHDNTRSNTKKNNVSIYVAHDPNKVLYHDIFNIKSSILKSWGVSNILYYIKALLFRRNGYKLNDITVKGSDSNQLGADFIISGCNNVSSGNTTTPKVLLSYYCKDPTDRIDVSKMISTIQNYNNKQWQEQQ